MSAAAHTPVVQRGDIEELRELARVGRLAGQLSAPANARRASLGRALYSLVWPIVYDQVTRPVELRRGHGVCARRMTALAPDCVDGFHDDVEAVVEGIRRRAVTPIHDLEAWISRMAKSAVVDAHRRRRGALGAPQRPRVPAWLADALARDPWLTELALHVIEWVGIPFTAGHQLWPLDRWTDRRGTVTGDWVGSTPETTGVDVERVLAAMRTKAGWYQKNIEQPLGRKQTPTPVLAVVTPLPLVDRHDPDELRRQARAEAAVLAINQRISAGEDAVRVVVDVVGGLFHDDSPSLGVRLDRIVAAVLDIVTDAGSVARGRPQFVVEQVEQAPQLLGRQYPSGHVDN